MILDETTAAQWLGDTPLAEGMLERLCSSYPAGRMECREVARKVNNARLEGPECLEEAGSTSAR